MSEATVETTEEKPAETAVEETPLSKPDKEEVPAEASETLLGEKEGDQEPSKEESEAPSEPLAFDEVTMPEGMELTDEWKERLGESWKDYTKEQAEGQLALLDDFLMSQNVQAIESLNEKIAGYGAALAEHPEVVDRGEGGLQQVQEEAMAAARELFGSGSAEDTDLRRELRDTGLGGHPALILVMAKVARKLGIAEGAAPPLDGKPTTEKVKKRNLFPLSAPDNES